MTRRARAIAIALRRRPEPSPWLLWAMLALLLLCAVAAHAQTARDGTGAHSPTIPNTPVPTRPLQTGPTQTRGVLVPTRPVDPDIHAATPPATAFPMPVVKPPGTPGGNSTVIPK